MSLLNFMDRDTFYDCCMGISRKWFNHPPAMSLLCVRNPGYLNQIERGKFHYTTRFLGIYPLYHHYNPRIHHLQMILSIKTSFTWDFLFFPPFIDDFSYFSHQHLHFQWIKMMKTIISHDIFPPFSGHCEPSMPRTPCHCRGTEVTAM